ncbi:MAG: winged helix-turn-helix domain-containing protein [Candidatus Hadarchaeia archaeon]
MRLNIVKYIPPEVRLKITQDFIEEKGIRPLAREIDVNPKSVYKYKEGDSCPGHEVMEKILALVRKENEELYERNMELLENGFSNALDKALGGGYSNSVEIGVESVGQKATSGASVGSEETDSEGDKTVDFEETSEGIPSEKICSEIGVTNPFNKSKIKKILDSLVNSPGLSMEELVEETSLSESAIEKYLEMLENNNFVEMDDSGYKLLVGVGGVGA